MTRNRYDQCLLFLSHHVQPGAMEALAKLQHECGERLAIVPVFDKTAGDYHTVGIPGAVNVTREEATRWLPYPAKHRQAPAGFTPGNVDLPLMLFFRRNPGYRYYWSMEYDVRYNGNWRNFFACFADNDSDLLGTTIFDFSFRPDWMHWESLSGPTYIPLESRTRGLFPIYRLSNHALRTLDLAYCSGWGGHHEVVVPTVLRHAGATIEDFGGSGAYVHPNNINRFYTNTPGVEGLAPGTFVVNRNFKIEMNLANKLYHPIK